MTLPRALAAREVEAHAAEPVENALPLDEPWCGEFAEHDCGGVNCSGTAVSLGTPGATGTTLITRRDIDRWRPRRLPATATPIEAESA